MKVSVPTTCFDDLHVVLSRPRIEPQSFACVANVLPLRLRGDPIDVMKTSPEKCNTLEREDFYFINHTSNGRIFCRFIHAANWN